MSGNGAILASMRPRGVAGGGHGAAGAGVARAAAHARPGFSPYRPGRIGFPGPRGDHTQTHIACLGVSSGVRWQHGGVFPNWPTGAVRYRRRLPPYRKTPYPGMGNPGALPPPAKSSGGPAPARADLVDYLYSAAHGDKIYPTLSTSETKCI